MIPQKLIIFDLDGTLYDLNDVMSMSYQMQIDFFSEEMNMSKEEAKSFLADHDVMPTVSKNSKSATELFQKMGIDKRKWSEYRESHFDVSKINTDKAVTESVVRQFSDLGIIVLLSSNAFSVIDRILKHINISSSIFNEVVCSDRFPYECSFTKIRAMQYLAEKYEIAYSDMYSIGDRFSTDIRPILDLGGHGFLLSNPNSLDSIFDALKLGNFVFNDSFVYY